ncbi:MAG: efflux RND transporter periplasmic adaptor subunit, partial [Terriglobales bacterium]
DQAASAQVDAAQAALAGAKQELAANQAAQQRVQTMFAYARITAPFAGVITNRYADTGAMIQAGTTQAMPVVRLAEEDVLRLGIPVPESVVPMVHIGTPAQVQVAALGRTFAGRVARFARQIDFDTRTMYTEIDVPNPQRLLVPGMYAYATLGLQQRRNVLAIPVQAVNRQAGSASVLVVTAQRQLATVPVRLGLETPDAVEVLSGLHEGDLVVVSGASLLRSGQAVAPMLVTLPTAAGTS